MALAVGVPDAAFVERESRVDQLALVVGQVLRAVEGVSKAIASKRFTNDFARQVEEATEVNSEFAYEIIKQIG